jgi:signal transduction histidine kinase
MIGIKKRFKRSLAARLMFVFALSASAIVMLIVAILIGGFGNQWKVNVRPHLEQYLDYIHQDIGNPPNVEQAKKLTQRLPINIYIQSDKLNYSSTGAALDLEGIEFETREHGWGMKSKSYLKKLQKEGQQLAFADVDDRILMRNQFDGYQVYFELIHENKDGEHHRLRNWSICALLLIFALSFWQLRRMLRPVQDIKIGVKQMGKGDLKYRVPVRADNDLGELSTSINRMAEDIELMLDAKRALLLAMSHELRSPLTRAKIAVQMLEESNNAKRLEEDLLEMEHLITDILEAERINTKHAVLNKEPMQIEVLVRSVITQLPENNIHIAENNSETLPLVELDEQRMRLLLRNLLSNAICHGGHAVEPPSIALSIVDHSLNIVIKDHGRGMSKEELEHITEPFYRADDSRTRDTGGFGIGLYLCQLIVVAHDGEMTFESQPNVGTTVKVSLPLVCEH